MDLDQRHPDFFKVPGWLCKYHESLLFKENEERTRRKTICNKDLLKKLTNAVAQVGTQYISYHCDHRFSHGALAACL